MLILSILGGRGINFWPLLKTFTSAEVKILLLRLRAEVGLRASGGLSLKMIPRRTVTCWQWWCSSGGHL